MFQVVTETKSGQFRCRVCNERQYCKTIFERSSKARDVRIAAQELNAERAAKEEADDECDSVEEQEGQDPEHETINWEQFLSPAKRGKGDSRCDLNSTKRSPRREKTEEREEIDILTSSYNMEMDEKTTSFVEMESFDEKSTSFVETEKFDEKRETKPEMSGVPSRRSFFVSDSDLEDLEVD